jgi:hypothetical protein
MVTAIIAFAFAAALLASEFRGTKKERREREDRAYFIYHP